MMSGPKASIWILLVLAELFFAQTVSLTPTFAAENCVTQEMRHALESSVAPTRPLVKLEVNQYGLDMPGKFLVDASHLSEQGSKAAELSIPQAVALSKSAARALPPGSLTSNSVTEIVLLNDLKQAETLGKSPSGNVLRSSGPGYVLDEDLTHPYRRLFISKDSVTSDYSLSSTLSLKHTSETHTMKVAQRDAISQKTIGPLIPKESSLHIGGLISVSAEPPEGFFAASSIAEFRKKGWNVDKADQANVWLYRVPDARSESYFKFNYASPDRALDGAREEKFKIAAGLGPAHNPGSQGGSEAQLLWLGDEQQGALDSYLKTISRPDFSIQNLTEHAGFVQKLPGNQVYVGNIEKAHGLTSAGFEALETDPSTYRRVFSDDYDRFLLTLFDTTGKPEGKKSYLLGTSRGCTQGCAICCSGGLKAFQSFSSDRMMEELRKIAMDAKIRPDEKINLFFVDSNFNNNPNRIIEFAEKYNQSELNGKFNFYVRHNTVNGFLKPEQNSVKAVNEELVLAYQKLGIDEIFMGVDSFDDASTKILKTNRIKLAKQGADARPTYTSAELESLIATMDKHGLKSKGFLLTNTPWVSDLDRTDSYFNILELWLKNKQFSIDADKNHLRLKPFEGSPIEQVSSQMPVPPVKEGRYHSTSPYGELDEAMDFSPFGKPRVQGDTAAALRSISDQIDRIQTRSEEILSNSSSSPDDQRLARAMIQKAVERSKRVGDILAQSDLKTRPEALSFLRRVAELDQKYAGTSPLPSQEQLAQFKKASDEFVSGLAEQSPAKRSTTSAQAIAQASRVRAGYEPELASLKRGQPHTIKKLDTYIEDNMGAATVDAAKDPSIRFVIVEGNGTDALKLAEQQGWKLEAPIQKRVGFHEIRPATDAHGNKALIITRINGKDRVLHMQSFLKLLDVPAERVYTTGAYHPWKQDYLDTFRRVGHVPDHVVYGLTYPSIESVIQLGFRQRGAGTPEEARLVEAFKQSFRRGPQLLPPEKDMEGMKLRIVELENGQKIWFLPPLFGELPKELMEALIETGAKDITYLGTAGGLKPTSHVGDFLSPTKAILADGNTRALTQLTPVRNKTADASYLHVSTPNVETQVWHENALARGADVTEVELGHVFDTFDGAKDIKKRVVLALSDVLAGPNHADLTEVRAGEIPNLSSNVKKLMQEVLGDESGKIAAPVKFRDEPLVASVSSKIQAQITSFGLREVKPGKYQGRQVVSAKVGDQWFSTNANGNFVANLMGGPKPKHLGKEDFAQKLRVEVSANELPALLDRARLSHAGEIELQDGIAEIRFARAEDANRFEKSQDSAPLPGSLEGVTRALRADGLGNVAEKKLRQEYSALHAKETLMPSRQELASRVQKLYEPIDPAYEKVTNELLRKITDPDEVGGYLSKLYLDTSRRILRSGTDAEKAELRRTGKISRAQLLEVLKAKALRYGWTYFERVPDGITDREGFRKTLEKGIPFFDEPFLGRAHGSDTHILQILFLSEFAEKSLGPGGARRFMKYLTNRERLDLWNLLFDFLGEGPADFSNPEVFTSVSRAWLGTQ